MKNLDLDKITPNELRLTALNWWNDLMYDKRFELYEEYKSKIFTPATTWRELTGREIQTIWAVKSSEDEQRKPDESVEDEILIKQMVKDMNFEARHFFGIGARWGIELEKNRNKDKK